MKPCPSSLRSLEPLVPKDNLWPSPPHSLLPFKEQRSCPHLAQAAILLSLCFPVRLRQRPGLPRDLPRDLGFPETCPIFCSLLRQSQEPTERMHWHVPCPELHSCLYLLHLWVDVGAFDHPGLLQLYELSDSSGCSGYKSGSCTVLCLSRDSDCRERGGRGWREGLGQGLCGAGSTSGPGSLAGCAGRAARGLQALWKWRIAVCRDKEDVDVEDGGLARLFRAQVSAPSSPQPCSGAASSWDPAFPQMCYPANEIM